MKFTYLTLALASLAALSSCSSSDDYRVSSPDGKITVEFVPQADGFGAYNVTVNGDTLLRQSQLGIVASQWNLAAGKPVAVSRNQVNETWSQPWGENKECINHYNEMAITLGSDADKNDAEKVVIRFRVFDDGMALRYELDTQRDSLTITDELTEFAFAPDGDTWSYPANFETYELNYRRMHLSDVPDSQTPFTFRTDGNVYGSIHEAALYDYPEMTLRRDSASHVLKADLAPLPDGIKAYVPGKFTTPWRTMQISDKAIGLINSCMILNLNEPSKIADTSWIKPQKYVGVWWGMHLGTQTWTMGPRHGATTANAIKHIDFAAANNLQGVLFEGWNLGWDNWGGTQHFDYLQAYPDFDVAKIAAYAQEKGIELWMHNETGGNIPEYEAALDSAFAYYHSLGVHTVKTGYAGGFKGGYFHHSQYGVRHYQKVVETAAKYQIMIDAHEPIKETGIRRTWPNMMTREGARGMEWNAWSEGNTPEYLTTLPYVRLLSGPMDYTPGIFDIDYSTAKADKGRLEWNGPNGYCRVHTTLARQIAHWVIIYSPLQMAADLLENYQGHPAFQFFRDFNADCDWSQALDGEIGEYIVVARRAGDRFFLGAGTNDQSRTLTVPLDFLEAGTTYYAAIYADDPDSDNPEAYKILHQNVTAADTLTIAMNPAGGQAISFIPQDSIPLD